MHMGTEQAFDISQMDLKYSLPMTSKTNRDLYGPVSGYLRMSLLDSPLIIARSDLAHHLLLLPYLSKHHLTRKDLNSPCSRLIIFSRPRSNPPRQNNGPQNRIHRSLPLRICRRRIHSS